MKHDTYSVRKGDTVEVGAGKDRGKRGKVLRVLAKKDRVVVEGVNFAKRHTRPSQKARQGGIVEKEMPLHVSNARVVCPRCSKATRIGRKREVGGGATRVCKSCGEAIDAG
ncbi:MAG: 50S ribosomal protein L24 [bacterium]